MMKIPPAAVEAVYVLVQESPDYFAYNTLMIKGVGNLLALQYIKADSFRVVSSQFMFNVHINCRVFYTEYYSLFFAV